MSSKEVILYFENESDAVHFTVAASSLISEGDSQARPDATRLIQPLARAHRIRVAPGKNDAEEPEVLPQAEAV